MGIKKCLILGGTGFLGTNLCKFLLENNYIVKIYTHKSDKTTEWTKKFKEIEIIIGDFTKDSEAFFINILSDVDIVFHLLSTTNPSNKDILYDFETNVLPTVKFLNACIKTEMKKIIYFSSGGTIYGIPQYLPIDENHRTEPISSYGIHKLSVEKCFEYYGRMYGLKYTILRISNPYGVGQNPFANQGVIAAFIAKGLLNQPIDVWGNGESVRDYIFVEDLMLVCMKLIKYKGTTSLFNVGSGIGYSLNQIITLIQKEIDMNVKINYLEARRQDVPVNILNINLIEKELDWRPMINLEEGIRRMLLSWDLKKERFEF